MESFSQAIPNLELIKVETRPGDFINREDDSNRDANGNLAAGIIIQSNLSDLSFEASNGIIRTQVSGNEWKILVSENERLLTVYSEGFLPLEIILSEVGVELVSGSFWLIQIGGVGTGPGLTGSGNFTVNTNPSGATIKIEGLPDFRGNTPYTFDGYAAQTYRVTAEKPDFEPVTFPMSILNGGDDETTIELKPLFGFLDINVITTSGQTIRNARITSKGDFELQDYHPKSGFETLPIGLNEIYVEASGYQSKTISVNIASGVEDQREVILLSDDEVNLLPSDVSLRSDNNVIIEAFGQRSVNNLQANNINPGSYEIRIIHAMKSFDEEIFVPPNQEVDFYFPVLPSRPKTIAIGTIPGLGHITTDRNRGWAYLGLTVAAYAFSYLQYEKFLTKQDELALLVNQYQSNTDESLFTELRRDITHLQSKRNDAYNLFQMGMMIGIGIHISSFTDISLSKPEFGFR